MTDLKVIADSIHPKSTDKQKKLRAISEMPEPLTDEKDIWDYARRNKLIPIILEKGLMSEEELARIKDLFQTRVTDEESEALLDKFTMAVANLVQ